MLCCTETFEFACASAHTNQSSTCDPSRRYKFHIFFFFKLLNFRTKFNVSRLVLDIKKYISSQGTIPFCMFVKPIFLKTSIFCFPSKRQIFATAMEWFPDNHKLEMKVLKCNNAIFLLFFNFRSDFDSYRRIKHGWAIFKYLCRGSEILDYQNQIICGGLLKMIKWKWRV